ncbi:putative disease resistance protein RGA3 [Camellia lanceoleosa]|uniref:Disease resistance protein RGA3 n=1 Tax=Camellia lanceoleosa TaxID=1840588 RepID=A0ACC0HGC2_9ERIC|nr:putative disease resistance protein RGA3 [Camellia lanceoleosa]
MAKTIVFNVAIKVLRSLGSLAIKEVGLGWNLDEELKTLESTLSTIKEVLSYAEEKQGKNHVVKIWYERLQVTFYEADNLLDEFQHEALRRQVQSMKLNHHHHSRSSIRIQKLGGRSLEASGGFNKLKGTRLYEFVPVPVHVLEISYQ